MVTLDMAFWIVHCILMMSMAGCIINNHVINVSLLAVTRDNVRPWVLGGGWRFCAMTQRYLQVFLGWWLLCWLQLLAARWLRNFPVSGSKIQTKASRDDFHKQSLAK